jgi:hypothetical protein
MSVSSALSADVNQAFALTLSDDLLYINLEMGYRLSEGYSCRLLDLATGKLKRIWKMRRSVRA